MALDDVKVDGVFIAIGHTPNTGLFEGHLAMKGGYLMVHGGSEGKPRTSVGRVRGRGRG